MSQCARRRAERPGRRAAPGLAGAALLLALAGPAAGEPPPGARLELRVAHPEEPAAVDPAEPAFVAGEALLELPASEGLDAVLVLDVSASTGLYAGEDVDGDGILDQAFGGADSVLRAETDAALRVLDALPGGATRVALVVFSDEGGTGGAAARLLQGLTGDGARLRRELASLRARRPRGMTNMAAALERTEAALATAPGGAGRDRVALFFTDGAPTGPHDSTARNVEAAVAAARRLGAAGVRIHTFAIGREALESPEAPIGIAEATGGYFTPVRSPSDLAGVAERVARASVRSVSVRNLTTDEPAADFVLDHDGSWSALVAVEPGRNLIAVRASALGGAEAERVLVIRGDADAPPQRIPAELEAQRRAVLRARLERERRRTEELSSKLREKLSRGIEQERERRRELELRPERAPEAGAQSP